jgi:hypothetical protein
MTTNKSTANIPWDDLPVYGGAKTAFGFAAA